MLWGSSLSPTTDRRSRRFERHLMFLKKVLFTTLVAVSYKTAATFVLTT